jgi:hypothetical protein
MDDGPDIVVRERSEIVMVFKIPRVNCVTWEGKIFHELVRADDDIDGRIGGSN